MNIRVKSTNVNLSPAISDFIAKNLGKISRMIDNNPAVECDVEVSRTTKHHQKGDIFMAEVHLLGDGIDAYATATHEDLNTAIADVRDEIVNKLRSSKGKRMSYMRRGGAKVKAMIKGLMPWGESGWYRKRK